MKYYYKMITTINPVTIHHHTKFLQNYWLYPLCAHYIPMIYFIAVSFCLLIPFNYFVRCLTCSSLVPTSLFSISKHLFQFYFVFPFVLFFYSLHICEIMWYLFFSFWFILLNYNNFQDHPSCLKWKDFTFFYGWTIFYKYIYIHTHTYISIPSSLSIHLLMDT